eukprot:snap_masked-scaffold_16-processed-gene-6.100-mRNA-1 protein AED:1.00 eAED:1.00 QI:0/0/0/0/1/1/2/0/111
MDQNLLLDPFRTGIREAHSAAILSVNTEQKLIRIEIGVRFDTVIQSYKFKSDGNNRTLLILSRAGYLGFIDIMCFSFCFAFFAGAASTVSLLEVGPIYRAIMAFVVVTRKI